MTNSNRNEHIANVALEKLTVLQRKIKWATASNEVVHQKSCKMPKAAAQQNRWGVNLCKGKQPQEINGHSKH